MTLIKSTGIKIKIMTSLSLIILFLLIISLKLRLLKKKNTIKKTVKEAIKLLRSMLLTR